MTLECVSVRVVEGDDGIQMARCVFSDVAFTVSLDAVAFYDGVLRIAVPAAIEAPLGSTVVERWLPPSDVQVRLAVEALDATVVERILLREMNAESSEPFGVLARRAVACACSGDTGVED